ncbi:MAG TPA: DUF948 domain-containing protein [bacterium]|nr:DUF948 domain-containing protein [bacterium]
MPVILQICAAVITLTFVILAIVVMRTMVRFERAADSFSKTAEEVRTTISDVKVVTHEMREVVSAWSETASPIKNVAHRIAELGNRATDLTSSIVEEVEIPVRKAVALTSGIRLGTSYFLDRVMERLGRRSTMSTTNER